MTAYVERARRLSREVAFAVDRAGLLTWTDERAIHVLGVMPGRPLTSCCTPGVEAKLAAFLEAARRGPTESWELSLLANGVPTTFVLRAELVDDVVLVVGSVSPEHAHIVEQLAAALGDVADLQRESERQRQELAAQHRDLLALYGELADSNRGLVRLHGELDDHNEALRRANDVKGRVVANVSHEFRTPINSILGITQLLLDRLDGDLTPEQEKQLRFIRSSAESLNALTNDLLDLSRIEAGRHQLRVTTTSASEMLASIRGMMRPLFTRPEVTLIVEPPAEDIVLSTDDGKISQVLRNLVANAEKFTDEGTVTVSVERVGDDRVAFRVADTGIGIAPEHHEDVFEEFVQVHEPRARARGTGLGLSLSRRLAEVLGGTLTVESELGRGSTFVLTVPAVHEEIEAMRAIEQRSLEVDPARAPVLVVEDDRQTMFLYERYLSASGFQTLPARTIDDARRILERVRPCAIVLDVMLEGESSWRFLAELKESEEAKDIPCMVVTVVDHALKARALGADEFWLKPVDGDRLIRKLADLSKRSPIAKVLVIDDDEASRYLMRRLLAGTPYTVLDTADGAEGVRLARTERPSVIVLDFVLGDSTAFDVLDDLKVDPLTRSIPVIIQTAKPLEEAERVRLSRETASIVQKQNLSRELAIARIREALLASGVGRERADAV
jgi:signal transduction histidine kinase/CheY-like chemotaxis protein